MHELLIFVVAVAVVAWILALLCEQLPSQLQMPLKVLIVILAIVVIFNRLLPLSRMH